MILRLEKARVDNWTQRKFFDGTSAKIGPSIDNSGHPVTGLTPTEEKKFEKELGLPAGTLGKNSNYWNNFMIVVDLEGVRLDDEVTEDQLKIKFLEAQSLVAKGSKELKINSKAEYVLFSEKEEKEEKNKVRRARNKVLALVAGMSLEERKGMVYMFGHNPTSMDEDSIEDFVYEKAEEDPKVFSLIAEDPAKDMKVFIHKLVKKGILAVKGGAYLSNDENIGYGVDSVAIMLKDKKNQELRIALEKQLSNA